VTPPGLIEDRPPLGCREASAIPGEWSSVNGADNFDESETSILTTSGSAQRFVDRNKQLFDRHRTRDEMLLG
jgi:hypothetical protein